MLSLPQPSTPDVAQAAPILVAMAEDAETLDLLLRFIYPPQNPEIKSVKQIAALLRATDKLFLEEIHKRVRGLLVSTRFRNPFEPYYAACELNISEEVKLLSRRPLWEEPITFYLYTTSKGERHELDYLRFCTLRSNRSRDAVRILENHLPKKREQVCVQCRYRRRKRKELDDELTKDFSVTPHGADASPASRGT
jgi:hypothetical protein